MLSISKPMSAGKAGQYFAKDDYYLSEKGEWQGTGASALGLSGEVDPEDFRSLMGGTDPITGEVLNPGKGKKHRAAIDVTFSAPKSVSIMAIADPEVKVAHETAVSKTLSFIEKNNAQTREMDAEGLRRAVNTGNLAIAKFNHIVSRELDPQLHTHAVIANLTRKEDGTWRALHNDSLYQDQKTLGRIYRNELALKLKARGYAIDVTDRDQTFFEIKGVSPELIQRFSTRREQIEQEVQRLKEAGAYPGASRARLYEIAALGSRARKQGGVTKEDLEESWTEKIAAQGKTFESLLQTTKEEGLYQRALEDHLPQTRRTEFDVLKTAADIWTQTESVFHKRDLYAIATKLALGEQGIDAFENAFKILRQTGRFVSLGPAQNDPSGSKILYSTRQMKRMERTIIQSVNGSKETQEPMATISEIDHLIASRQREQGWGFTEGQIDATKAVLTSRDGVVLIQGDAGTGKTAAMNLVREMSDRKGVSVLGLGFTGKAAFELEEGAGIPSRTLDSFFNTQITFVERGSAALASLPTKGLVLERGSLLVLDESSMAGSIHFSNLLKIAKEGDLKLAIVGDVKQFQSISAGRMFQLLQEKTSVPLVEMTEVLRQKTTLTQDLVKAISEKAPARALDEIDSHGHLVELSDWNQRLERVAKEYLQRKAAGKDTLVLTATNRDRRDLNERIRKELVEEGHLDSGFVFEVLENAGLTAERAALSESFKAGQVLLVTQKISDELPQGAKGKVLSVNPESNTLRVSFSGQARDISMGEKGAYKKVSVFNPSDQVFAVGDRVVFLKNDRLLGVQNGLQGIVLELDSEGRMAVETEGGKTVRFSLKEGTEDSGRPPYNYLTQGYALTEYKSQGATVHGVIWHADTGLNITTMNSFYVASTRATHDVLVVTDNKDRLMDQANKIQEKTSTLDYQDPKEKPQKAKPEGRSHETAEKATAATFEKPLISDIIPTEKSHSGLEKSLDRDFEISL